jgi:hypothetical protein
MDGNDMYQSTRSKAAPLSNNRRGVVGWRAMIPPAMVLAVSLLLASRAEPGDARSAPEPSQLSQATNGVSAAPDAKKRSPEMSFAYANSAGTALLAAGYIGAIVAAHLDSAICGDGRIITVKFTRMQVEAKRSTGRDDARNFNAAAGARFAVVGARASPVCLLAKRDFLAGKRILPIARHTLAGVKRPCDPSLRDRIPSIEQRPLTECTSVASIGMDAQLVAAVYQPHGDNLLAALVVLTKTGTFIKPLPAPEGNWRVDDDGDLQAEGIGPIFALATADGAIETALGWPAAEGLDLWLYKTSPKGVLEEVLTGYLYTAPQ